MHREEPGITHKLKIKRYRKVKKGKENSQLCTGKNLEFHAVAKSQLSNKSALLWIITSIARVSSWDLPEKFPGVLYCLSADINACLAALYTGIRICVEMPNLWSLIQKLVLSWSLSSELRESPISSFNVANWDGWMNPTSSLHLI